MRVNLEIRVVIALVINITREKLEYWEEAERSI